MKCRWKMGSEDDDGVLVIFDVCNDEGTVKHRGQWYCNKHYDETVYMETRYGYGVGEPEEWHGPVRWETD